MLRELDAAIGQQVERLVVSHHRRRLNRIGYGDVLSAAPGGWASSAPLPRPGNLLDVHVSITNGSAGVSFVGNDVSGSISITGNSGGFVFSGNSASGSVATTGNA
jgi:hypothetical protein